MSEGEGKPIRVVDRRMFTPEGELRPGFEPEEAVPESPRPEPPRPEPPRAAAPAPPSPPEELSEEPADSPEQDVPAEPRGEFARIVSSLATTAYSALGLLADPAEIGRASCRERV